MAAHGAQVRPRVAFRNNHHWDVPPIEVLLDWTRLPYSLSRKLNSTSCTLHISCDTSMSDRPGQSTSWHSIHLLFGSMILSVPTSGRTPATYSLPLYLGL